MKRKKRVFLVGNPNVGKSTVFNEITGLHQHTGNWSGKTVDFAKGEYYYKFNDYELIDLPGTYSLLTTSEEERVARDYLCFEPFDCVVCVVDATSLQRNLNLVYQVLELTSKVVVLLNLCDEAKLKNIDIDSTLLEEKLGVPVVRATARSGKGINELLEQIHLISNGVIISKAKKIQYCDEVEAQLERVENALKCTIDSGSHSRFYALRLLENNDSFNKSFCHNFGENILRECPLSCVYSYAIKSLENTEYNGEKLTKHFAFEILKNASSVSEKVIKSLPSKKEKREKILDKILLGKYTSIISMLVILGAVLWITISVSNYPSQLLQELFNNAESFLASGMLKIGVPEMWVSLIVGGILRVLFWVVAVMLPPMAIFFPLFALLEDFGVLPRIAFNLDGAFEACGACGKQALTTCMGYGCNAVGITGCRIIDSPRERLVAIITNSLSPCNGRLPPPTLWQLQILIIWYYKCFHIFAVL